VAILTTGAVVPGLPPGRDGEHDLMTEREDHEQLADELDHDVERMEQESGRLEEEISGVRDDWERKRADGGVPGAVPRSKDAPPETAGPEPEPEPADEG
jgi:hypothetical protein